MSFFAAGASVVSTGFGIFSSRKEGRAQARHARAEGERISRIHLYNAELDEINAEEALRQGIVRARQIRRDGAQQVGSFRALSGASGSRADMGSALQVEEYQTRLADEALLEELRNTAMQFTTYWGNAVSNRESARQAIVDGQTGAILARTQARNEMIGTALSGGAQLANIYNQYQWNKG